MSGDLSAFCLARFKSRTGQFAVGLTTLIILSFYAAVFFKYHDVLERWEVWHLSLISLMWLLGLVAGFYLIAGSESTKM